ncbi:unnamed protein product [Peronospora belbahrii]|uniref:Uncharacterized protein n=1 Tax=Peronospora belbahrii TaxID=622444 RepID=A0AAU9LEF0_9STRA|nr:unnamed protein product [Peronospora belbahrii]CAH0514266.1 unnamed protein product [Peronospora belbahrii]
MTDANAKLNSLFNKRKKKQSTTVNANVIVKTSAQSAERAATPSVGIAPTPLPQKISGPTTTASGKKLADLSLNKEDKTDKVAFQWAKQPKKYKNLDKEESVATTWAEQEQRNRINRRIQLDNERAFPSLGVDAAKVQLQNMKAPNTKAVETKNAWASLHDDEDEE